MAPLVPSSRPGMGAIAFAGGVAFRVWAPNAREVGVAGTFNNWSESAHPLAPEEGGHWSTEVPGANVGDEYKYVINGALWRGDPYAREISGPDRNVVVPDGRFDWGSEEFEMPPRNDLVIYELHPGMVAASAAKMGGALQATIAKFPYLRELGVNAIQLMPPHDAPWGFSWGYEPAHPFAIDRAHGGPKAFKEFVRSAHWHGLAVLFDVGYGFLGARDSDLWQFDGWQANNKGGIYFYNDWRSKTPWSDGRPDYGRVEVRRFLCDNARMWLTEYRLDGLRWSHTAYIRNVNGNNDDPGRDIAEGWQLIRWINDEIHALRPPRLSVAEDLRNNPWVTRQTEARGGGFDSQWDADFVFPVREVLITPDDADRNMFAVRDAITHRFDVDAFERVIYTESHDELAHGRERVPEEIWPGKADGWFAKKRSLLGAVLVFTSPGIPMIFQGQEFLECKWVADKAPIDWSKAEIFKGIRQAYRDLIAFRRNRDGWSQGLRGQHVDIHHFNDGDNVIAFHRWDRGGPRDSVIVVLNLANCVYDSYTIGFPRAGLWKVRFNSDASGYDASFGDCLGYDTVAESGVMDGMPCGGNVGVGPYSALILSQEE